MYSKYKDELGRLYNINKENSYSCRGCDIEPPSMTIDCPHCEQHNTILLEKYPPLDCTVQDLMNVLEEYLIFLLNLMMKKNNYQNLFLS